MAQTIFSRPVEPGKYLRNVQLSMNGISAEKVHNLSSLIRQSTLAGGRLFLAGEADLAQHLGTDGEKFGGIDTVCPSVPLLSASANDHINPYIGLFETKGLRQDDLFMVLTGENEAKSVRMLNRAFDYVTEHGGSNIVITGSDKYCLNSRVQNAISIKGRELSWHAAVHSILHFLGANQEALMQTEREEEPQDSCAVDFAVFASMIQSCTDPAGFGTQILDKAADKLRFNIESGGGVFSFGNGGSAAYASFFSDALRSIYARDFYSRNVFDLASNALKIDRQVLAGDFQGNGFHYQLTQYKAGLGDTLVGISTSGSSMNVVNALNIFRDPTKIAILGMPDGRAARMKLADYTWVSPNPGEIAGRAPKYAVLETLQMIALSYILNKMAYDRNIQ